MSLSPLEVVITSDTTSAIAGFAQVEAEIKKLTSAAMASGQALGGATGAMGGITAAASNAGAQIQHTTGHVGSLTSGLLSLSSAMQVFSMAMQVIGEFGSKMNAAREAVNQMTEDTMKLRDTLREVASLQGKDGPNNAVASDVLQLGMDSGMMPKDAVEFMEQFLGSSPAGKQKGNITEEVSKQVAVFGAQFGVQKDVTPKTAGDFSGVISQYQKVPDVETAAKVFGQINYGLNEGRGNMEPLVRTLLNTAGSVVDENGGPLESLADLAVMEGVASTHANPYATGTQLRQAVRALRKTEGAEGEWLAKQGANKPGMRHIDRLKAVKPELMREVASGKGLDQAIKEHITANDAEARSLMQQIGDIDLMDKRTEVMKTINGVDVIKSNEAFFGTGPDGAAGSWRKQLAKEATQRFLIGQANETRVMAQKNAEISMRDPNQPGGAQIGGPESTLWEFVQDGFGAFPFVGFMTTRDKKLLGRGTSELIAEARRVGLTEEEIFAKSLGMDGKQSPNVVPGDKSVNFQNYSAFRQGQGETEIKKRFGVLGTAVQAKGGNPYGSSPDLVPELKRLTENTKQLTEAIKKNTQVVARPGAAGGQKPGPQLPPPPPRPGGAAPKRP